MGIDIDLILGRVTFLGNSTKGLVGARRHDPEGVVPIWAACSWGRQKERVAPAKEPPEDMP
jgi:hypothetical protein